MHGMLRYFGVASSTFGKEGQMTHYKDSVCLCDVGSGGRSLKTTRQPNYLHIDSTFKQFPHMQTSNSTRAKEIVGDRYNYLH